MHNMFPGGVRVTVTCEEGHAAQSVQTRVMPMPLLRVLLCVYIYALVSTQLQALAALLGHCSTACETRAVLELGFGGGPQNF
jgi:hypothetical protein